MNWKRLNPTVIRDEMSREEKAIAFICLGLCWLALTQVTVGCQPDRERVSLPADRAPTLGEIRRAPMTLELTYSPPAAAPWDAWRGEMTAELGGPQAGLDSLPAVVALDSGFEELGCLDSLDGSWSAGAGTLAMVLSDGAGSTVVLSGSLVVRGFLENSDDDARTDPAVVERLVGEGTWTVVLGPTCEADDFAGGISGLWTCEVPDAETTSASERPVSPRARLLVVGPRGVELEVTGPVEKIAELVYSSR